MAVRTRGRRKIVVDGRRYIWFVAKPSDYMHIYWNYELRVVSEDKQLYIIYPLNPHTAHIISIYEGIDIPAHDEPPLVFVSGKEIGTMPHYDIKYRCPRFERDDGAITPQSVKDLIQWCLSDGEPRIRVDWKNRPI